MKTFEVVSQSETPSKKNKLRVITSSEDNADLYQTSLLPRPHEVTDLPHIILKVVDIIYKDSTFNLETGSRIIVVKARRWRRCFYGFKYTYSLQNPTWDGKALGLTIYDVENHRHVQLHFQVNLDMNPQIDALFSSSPVLE